MHNRRSHHGEACAFRNERGTAGCDGRQKNFLGAVEGQLEALLKKCRAGYIGARVARNAWLT